LINLLEAELGEDGTRGSWVAVSLDRKSTRLNSSHVRISYAVFCLKKKSHQPPRRRVRLSSHLSGPRPQSVVRQAEGECRFFFNGRGPPDLYALSRHDALPV